MAQLEPKYTLIEIYLKYILILLPLMSSPLERPLKFEIRLPSSHPQLLEGLDIWLRLGLISDTQVRQLCQEFLVCSVVLPLQPEAKKR